MLKRVLRCCAGTGVAVCVSVALAGCDANQKIDLASILNFPAPVAKKAASPTAASPPRQIVAVPPSLQLGRLDHKSTAEVQAMVGSPDFRRVEPPAELWQYRTAECVVDLFFYGDNEDRRVVHTDSRSRDPAQANGERCGDGSEVLKNRLRG